MIDDDVVTLMHEQFCCWLHDAESSRSVLRHYGFSLRLKQGFRIDDPLSITLSDSCVALERGIGRLIVSPRLFEPIFATTSSPATPLSKVPAASESLALTLLRDLFAWIGSYEQWVQDSFGEQYRAQTLGVTIACARQRPKRWWSQALRISALLQKGSGPSRSLFAARPVPQRRGIQCTSSRVDRLIPRAKLPTTR